MNIERLSKYNKYVKTLSDKEKLILSLKQIRKNFYTNLALYLAAVLFIIKDALESFATSVNYRFTIGNFSIFSSSLILMAYSFLKDVFTYLFILFALGFIFLAFTSLKPKQREIEEKIINKIKKHMEK